MHLSYCTNIHPAETWQETQAALDKHVLKVRQQLIKAGDHPKESPFAIGLRLSALAASELLTGDELPKFKAWLSENHAYVFTINGFPYGSFHGTRVKEKVFQPDWTNPARLDYTKQLFQIIAQVAPKYSGGSVSTLPGSHKTFHADENLIIKNLESLAHFIDNLAEKHEIDLHLGLEPEPLGHFENTVETLAFFEKIPQTETISRRIGLNYDACHFALQFDGPDESLDSIQQAGIRLSKIHLSNALSLDPRDPAALAAIRPFDEPVYFHQVIARRPDASLQRFLDLPEFFQAIDTGQINPADFNEARIHFHIPLDAQPAAPLRSTQSHVERVLAWHLQNPTACPHFEIETYTWAVLPDDLQRPVEKQLAAEYRWVLQHLQ